MNLIVLVSLLLTSSLFAQKADLILTNVNIHSHPRAHSIGIKDGKIIYIGKSIIKLKGPNTDVINMRGNYIYPGFIDNHNHFAEGGLVNCYLKRNHRLDEQINVLKKCKRKMRSTNWLIGYGHELETILEDHDHYQRPIDILDQIFPNIPVIIMEHSSHSMIVNSLALKKAGINHKSSDPPGGKLMRDEEGKLNGVLVDNAGDIVMEIAVNSSRHKGEESYRGLLHGLDELSKNGITTVGDGRTYWRRGIFKSYNRAQKAGKITARLFIRPWIYPHISLKEQLPALRQYFNDDYEDDIIVNQVKIYSDGVPENGTAKVGRPYVSTYFKDSPNGINYIGPQRLKNTLSELERLGYGAHIHAIGDQGIKESLDAIETMRNKRSNQNYHLTHVFMMNKSDVTRFKKLNVFADTQIGNAHSSNHMKSRFYIPFIGKKRAKELLFRPIKELIDANAKITLSSDWSVYPMNPLRGIANALEEKSMNIKQAFDAYTINAAQALGAESITGSIEVGKSADLVLLDKDIFKADPKLIRRTRILMTIYRGEIVFDR